MEFTKYNQFKDQFINQFKDEDLMFIDANKAYQYTAYDDLKTTRFSLLMKLVSIPNVDIELIKNVIKNTNINYKNTIGRTALMIACGCSNICNNLHIIKLLLENGADVNLMDIDGINALHIASRFSNTYSSIETVKLLLDYNANVNTPTNTGNTTLMGVSANSNEKSSIETVKLLLDNGADVNIQNKFGHTALMYASALSNTSSNIETVKLLLQHNADVSAQTSDNCSALTFAIKFHTAEKSNIETIKILLGHMIDNNNTIKMTNDIFKLMDDDILNYYIHKNVHRYENILIDLKSDINDIIKFTSILFKNHLYHKMNFGTVIKDIVKHRNAYYFHHDNIYSRIVLLCNDCFNHDNVTVEHIEKIKMLVGSIDKITLMEFKDYLIC